MVTHSGTPDRLDSLRFLKNPHPVQVNVGVGGDPDVVHLEDGANAILFQDLVDQGWYAHRTL